MLEVSAQNVGISNSAITADPSSILELRSTTGGFLMPRMTQYQKDLINNPATGLIIYQTNVDVGYHFYNGTSWEPLLAEGADDLGNHLYTQNMETDGNWLSGDGDDEGLFVADNGNVGIGTDAPAGILHVESPTSSDPFLIRNVKNSNNGSELVGVGFGSQAGSDVVKSGVVHERISANGTGKLHLLVDNSVDANDVSLNESRMTIDRYGKVGIGTTSPSDELHITNSGDVHIKIEADADNINDNDHPKLTLSQDGGSVKGWFGYETEGSNDNNLFISNEWNNAAGDIRFRTRNTTRMTLDGDGKLGVGTTDPTEMLQVEGNGQIAGYLKVGDPAVPQSDLSYSPVTIYGWTSEMAYAGWTTNSICGSPSSNWVWVHDNNFPDEPNYFEYDNGSSRSRKELHSPWMFVPTSSTTVRVEVQFECTLENNYDGVFLSYSTDGSSWTKVDNFSYHGYPDNAYGSNENCNGNASSDERECWNGNLSNYSCWTNGLPISGSWVQFKLTGMADYSNGSGDFKMYGFSVSADMPANIGGSFSAGNVYAENNIYAGSNVLLGDVAEYFAVEGRSEPGDVISIATGNREAYKVSTQAYDDKVIGVYSTAPTVTLNDPNSGVPVGLRGRVPVKVTSANGPIKVGDPITASHIPGHAMKADRPCYIIGRAIEPFDKNGEGKVLCLLENGWYNPASTEGFSSIGNFNFSEGKKSVKVFDGSISKHSKIFLTLLGDPGHRFWISEKTEGQFTIELSGESLADVPFDYLVENASNPGSSSYQSVLQSVKMPLDFETGNWQFDEEKGVYWREQEKTGTSTPIPQWSQSVPPAVPENSENAYIYYEQTKSAERTFGVNTH